MTDSAKSLISNADFLAEVKNGEMSAAEMLLAFHKMLLFFGHR